MLQGYQGDFVSVDLGHNGCRPWPAALSVTSPIAASGMPSDFSSDASGAAVQPAADSPSWTNLITVRDFKPSSQSLGCNGWDRCGVLAYNFLILPAGSTVKAPEVETAINDLLAYNVSVDITSDATFPLNASKWFTQYSRACCLNISAMLSTDNGLQQLPPWLSFNYDLTQQSWPIAKDWLPALTAEYMLKIHARPGVAAVGNHTVRILAADESLPNLSAAFVDMQLLVIGRGPSIVGQFPIVEVADGQPLDFAIPDNVFQLNKPYGQVSYSAEQQAGVPLPAWLSLAGDRTLKGTPNLGVDSAFNLSIIGSDSDGAQASTFLMLYIRVACPTGLYRHFRLKTSHNYDTSVYNRDNPAICSIAWGSSETSEDRFPNRTMMTTYNISGSTYRPANSWSGTRNEPPITAFQQLKDVGCSVATWFNDGDSWLVCTMAYWARKPSSQHVFIMRCFDVASCCACVLACTKVPNAA